MSAVDLDNIELPPFPEVAAAVLRAARNPDRGVNDVARLVQRDPALAATVLSVANRAAFGGGAPAVTLLQAISRLGVRQVSDLTVTACLRPTPEGAEQRAAVAPVWRHAVATAGYAREISRVRRRQVESAFLCGLLHSVGALVLMQHGERDLASLDRRYVPVGTQVVMHWGLPAAVVAAVGLHRDWQGADVYADEAATTWLARLLAQELLGHEPESPSIDEDPVLERLDLYPADLDRVRGHGEEVLDLVLGLE